MPTERRIHFPPFALDPVNECLWKGSRPIGLRPKAFAVLQLLVSRAGELVTKQQLIDAIWQDAFVGDAVLKVAVRQIREALSDDPRSPRFIETAHRRGYRFIGAIAARGAAATGRASADPPGIFVGREGALSQMHAWLEKARAGECQVVFVTGEAGIGKTTLLERFTQSIAADPTLRVCHGQCLEQYGMSEAYLPVLDAMRQLCREHAQVADVLRAHAPMWLMQMPSLVTSADREAFGREALGATRERMLREMGDALDALAARAVLVLVLEDLHWSDLSTLDLISYVGRRRRPAQLMLIGTYRPAELIASRHPLKTVKQELAAGRQCQELPLECLTRESVEQHLAARFPVNRFPADLVTLIHDRTDGNPLFMVNTIDHLVAERLIEAHGDGWRLAASIDTVKVGVPESIRQLIETQIDRLDGGDQRILDAASVAGAEFSAVAVAAALDDDPAAVEACCDDLSRRHQFIKPCGAQLLPNGQIAGRFAFVHAVYRHVLYDRISAARRPQLHRRVGLRGEELYGERVTEIAAELAMHFEQAADHDRTIRYLQLAADNAMRRSAYREAIDASRRGLELLAALPDTDERARQELRLQMTLGVPLIATEGYAAPEVGTVYERAHRLCERLGTAPETSQALWGLWTFRALRAELSFARGLAGELLRLGARTSHPGVLVRGHWAMEITRTHRGEFRDALEHFGRLAPLCDSPREADDPFADALDAGVAVRCFAGWCLWFVGQPDRAAAPIQDAVALATRLSQPHGLAHALVFAAVLHQFRRERPAAREFADAALALAAGHELVLYAAMARIVRGWALSDRTDGDRAARQIRDGLAAWHGTGAQLMRPYFLALLADAVARAGRDDEALCILEEAQTVAQSTGERMYEAEISRLRGELFLTRAREGDVEQAEACFQESLAIARRQDALSLELRTAMSLARLPPHRRGHVPAGVLLSEIYRRFDEGFETLDLQEARALLAPGAGT